MSDTSTHYRRVAAGFTARVEGIDPEGWAASVTPCPEWTVVDLVSHVTRTHRGVIARLDDLEAGEVDPDGDLLAQWRQASTAVTDALEDEDRAGRIVGGMFGEQSFESLVRRLVCTDTLVHTWDLARTTGQEERLDPEGVALAMGFLGDLGDAIRSPGGFGPEIEPAVDADEQTKFINFCGRVI